MFGIGTGELLLILVIAMLVVGPERMVDYARRGGRLLVKIREQTDQVTKDFREALDAETGELKDANPLAAIADLKAEADAAARISRTSEWQAHRSRPAGAHYVCVHHAC